MLLLMLACTDPKQDPESEQSYELHIEDGALLNQQNQSVLLRGLNARVNGIFDVEFDDGRIALAKIPDFSGEDCRFMSEQLGHNLLRLPINWSGIEPEDDQYDQAYIDSVFALVDACYEHGVYTIVDLHQDAYSKEIGEDGAPLWAIYPPPEELLEGPLEDLEQRRASVQVLAAFSSLYRNEQNLRDAYIEMTLRIAEEMQGHRGAVALELQNEPVVFGQVDLLSDFHDAIMIELRAKYPNLPVVFEPDSLRNFTDNAGLMREFSWSQAIYGPHIYTDVFEDGWTGQNVDDLDQSVDLALEEAEFHQAHLFVGEFGNGPSTEHGFRYIVEALEDFDRVSASWAFWLYEEYSIGSWGLFEQNEQSTSQGPLREELADVLARPFPEFLSGTIRNIEWSLEQKVLTISLQATGTGEHRVTAPLRIWPNGPQVLCDGQPVSTTSPRVGRVQFTCAGSEIVVQE